ncbi:PREDICTED: chymotrypsin-2-like [Dinoponera quadriceps]|uniref:Chymotrypsin-2-like n=1 Tax=Dinoponera quadriceps TaxID=609295 RepID=A0A6P3XYM1_DINQU|nr:PREDICTED: chymotrypsin-2-like [Dinoponera quadriceps]
MLPLIVVLVLGVFAQQTFADEPEAIVGGTPAAPGEFPHQCSVRVPDGHICGCSIVTPTCIVTAAHCLVDVAPPPYNSLKVVTGILESSGGVERPVKYGIVHPNYMGTEEHSWANDVAVLKLKEPIQFNELQSSIKLATRKPSVGTQCIMSGWGQTSSVSFVPVAPYLLKAYTKIVDNDRCKKAHGNIALYNVHLCAYARRGIGACSVNIILINK